MELHGLSPGNILVLMWFNRLLTLQLISMMHGILSEVYGVCRTTLEHMDGEGRLV